MARNENFETTVEYAPFTSINKDRPLTASKLARWLSSTNSNGVARQLQELKVEPQVGMNVILRTGIGLVEGHHMYQMTDLIIPIEASNVSGDRWDVIGFRLLKKDRKVLPYYKEGEVGTGLVPATVNDDTYVEIPLYNIRVGQNTTSINIDDLIDVREFVVSSATIFKKYSYSNSVTSTITIPNPYNSETDSVELWVNDNGYGKLLLDSQYTISGNIITLNKAFATATNVQLNVWHFQDSTGSIDSLKLATENFNAKADELNNKVLKYYYYCKGSDDNFGISDVVQNFINDSTINQYAQMELIICGDCSVSQPINGSGTSNDPYIYFYVNNTSDKTVYLNFANCSRIDMDASVSSSNIAESALIFHGSNLHIKHLSLNITAGFNVDVFNGSNNHVVDSNIWMTTTTQCRVAVGSGYYENIRTSILSTNSKAYCFYANGDLMRVIGGTHYAWCRASDSTAESVVFYTAANARTTTFFVTMTNCPLYARSGYAQTHPAKINHGFATFMMNRVFEYLTVESGHFYSENTCIAYGNTNSESSAIG